MILTLTGATGFLGKIIIENISEQFEIITVGRNGCTIISDLSFQVPDLKETDIVVHVAGKAHTLPKTDEEAQDFFNVNVIGTQNLLKAIDELEVLPTAFIFISSVAVYGLDRGLLISENEQLQAKDPYGLSKIYAEKLIIEWCEKNNVICSILRLPLLIAENPPGNLGAMIRGIEKGYYFNIDSGKARKSVVLAQDVAKIIPVVASKGGIYNLTDGHNPSFAELSAVISRQLGKREPLSLPLWLARFIAKIGDLFGNKVPINSNKLRKITSDLTFDDSLAKKELNWKPTSALSGLRAIFK